MRESLERYIENLAREINAKYSGYSVGNLRSSPLFADNTIVLKGENLPYAYHLGGRKNLQFNIGFEPGQEGEQIRFRHGVAFAFQGSYREGYDIDAIIEALRPKTKGFDKCVQKIMGEQSTSQVEFKTWYWNAGKLHEDDVPPVSELVQDDVFYMFGKHVSLSKFKEVATDDESIIEHWTDKVLDDFDFLYENVYLHVQNGAG